MLQPIKPSSTPRIVSVSVPAQLDITVFIGATHILLILQQLHLIACELRKQFTLKGPSLASLNATSETVASFRQRFALGNPWEVANALSRCQQIPESQTGIADV